MFGGYFRKIPVERLNFPRLSAHEIVRKYPSQTWYICSEYTITLFTDRR